MSRRSTVALVRRAGGAAAGLVLSLVGVAVGHAAPGDTILVSRATGPSGVSGNENSVFPSISGDGRRVAFSGTSSNLAPDDRVHRSEIFVRDVGAQTTALVSRASGRAGAKGDGPSLFARISADGRFIAFESSATNLTSDDRDQATDIFVRDLQAKTTTLVSRASGRHGAKANSGGLGYAAISADGRFVAFVSTASNLARGDRDHRPDVFVRDLQANTTTLVNREPGGLGGKCRAITLFPAISADGRFIAFTCSSDQSQQVFVHDQRDGATSLVSRADGANGAIGDRPSLGSPAISADGRFVAFVSAASNLTADVRPPHNPAAVFVRDLDANTTTLASRASGPVGTTGDGPSTNPSLSGDGRLVAFESYSTNLVPDDPDRNTDILVRDQAAAATTLVSRGTGTQGAKGADFSYAPSMSLNGRFVAFGSIAGNLTPDHLNATFNVFVRELQSEGP
jgi:Tol biopolymer transport system component